ncbi:4-(cytidine 5'-diphospho)-2-C-methyl-D-erythritol kinase [Baekduia soli]|uniref:4-diphosphocytidyl-2-C-methyl-D-erythritol kinase n=1 Tax=Baekduia soli TaxID=496014 RepID=A0A5B8U366_9ACTN|nr:4-(cytidine 5'-diphospho)-2-C-methyl-D-erythritol kinase [Baekduia soli]QEC47484.1 4-(cytidine 5'-diphospho)-2-C-methyl-D-erythritol kinase [Baekduia soli]
MTLLETRAPAKINVCLYLGPTREDGRHELVSVMQSVSLTDRVRLEHAAERDEVVCPGVDGENLVGTAIARFRAQTGWDGDPVRISIKKRIPVAAGMAGGSADAAAALRLLGRASGREDPDLLTAIAEGLGSDVPAQVLPGRVLATGAGERLERVPGVARYAVLVVPAGRPLATPDVYREADRLGLGRDHAGLEQALQIVRAGLPDLADPLCVNELEPAALSLCPELAETLDAVRGAGADVAMVSGSGPTVLGLFHDPDAGEAAVQRFPGAVVTRPVGPHAGEVLAS